MCGGEGLRVACAERLLGPGVRERGGFPALGSSMPMPGLCLRAFALLAGAVRLLAPVAAVVKLKEPGAAGTVTLGEGG